MNEIYFSVSLNGIFVFRTDKFDSPQAAERCEMTLRDRIVNGLGYEIHRYERSATWDVTRMKNEDDILAEKGIEKEW